MGRHRVLDLVERGLKVEIALGVGGAHLIFKATPDRVQLLILGAHQLGPVGIGGRNTFVCMVGQVTYLRAKPRCRRCECRTEPVGDLIRCVVELGIGRLHCGQVERLGRHRVLDLVERGLKVEIALGVGGAHLIFKATPDRVQLLILGAHQLGLVGIGGGNPLLGVLCQVAHLLGQWWRRGKGRNCGEGEGEGEQTGAEEQSLAHQIAPSASHARTLRAPVGWAIIAPQPLQMFLFTNRLSLYRRNDRVNIR